MPTTLLLALQIWKYIYTCDVQPHNIQYQRLRRLKDNLFSIWVNIKGTYKLIE